MEREYKILKEIQEQLLVAKHMFLRQHEKELTDAVSSINQALNNNGEIYLVGSGSSYNSAVYASHLFAESNHFILGSMKELSEVFESGQYISDKKILKRYRTDIYSKHSDFVKQIYNSVSNLNRIYNFQILEPLLRLL